MTISELYDQIIERFCALPGVKEVLEETITIKADTEPEATLMPEGDVPSPASRPEYRVTAEYKGAKGEAYTETPADFEGMIHDAVALSLGKDAIDARSVAAINAVMNHFGLCAGTFSDEPEAHQAYAEKICAEVIEKYGKNNIALIGYDGYIVKKFMDEGMVFWTLDRNPDNVTKDRFHHVIVNSGRYNREACFAWAKLLIVTGSTLCNGTILPYLESGADVKFYGITFAGVAKLLDLPWFEA